MKVLITTNGPEGWKIFEGLNCGIEGHELHLIFYYPGGGVVGGHIVDASLDVEDNVITVNLELEIDEEMSHEPEVILQLIQQQEARQSAEEN